MGSAGSSEARPLGVAVQLGAVANLCEECLSTLGASVHQKNECEQIWLNKNKTMRMLNVSRPERSQWRMMHADPCRSAKSIA